MKYIFLLLPGLLLAGCGKDTGMTDDDNGPSEPKKEGPIIKVMTYNIHRGNPPSEPAATIDMEVIAQVINDEKPDLVALQEVDVHTRRSGVDLHQARVLAELTDMHFFFTRAIYHDGGEYGDAVLSRFPILDSMRYVLPVTSAQGGETRSVAMITVEVEGTKFRFASTHLDHLGAEGNRLLQAGELLKIVKAAELPLIIAGDLNARPESETMKILQKELTSGCPLTCPLTFPAEDPDRTIDYILISDPDFFEVLNYSFVNETYASDHLPLVARFELPILSQPPGY